jgi:hypothetical protein
MQRSVLLCHSTARRGVPSKNSVQLAERLPNGELIPLYTDAGHGGIFQYHEEFVPKVLDFLKP